LAVANYNGLTRKRVASQANMDLHIQLLGGFDISFEGSPVSGFHQPRLQTLLAYILLNRQALHPRSSIAFLFWPDSSDKQARTNLRRLLHTLRRALPQSERFLALTTETIQWRNDGSFLLDLAQFEDHLQQAAAAGTPEHRQAALQKAVSAYGGDFLPGFHDEWILAERERLRSLYADALTQLAALYEAERDYRAAVDVARRLLHLDMMQESTYRLLMQLHLFNNDRAAALAIYHRCTTVLNEELGVEPSPLTEELYLRVLRLEMATQEPSPRPRSTPALPLVGREEEWRLLEQVWRRARIEGPSLLVLQGEAGVGKTRLAEELVNSARRQGMGALQTRAYAVEGAGPYSPLVDLLRSEGHLPALARLEPVWLGELARLLPELRAGRKDIPAPLPISEAWQRQRFHEALARGVLAAGQPLLIHFDDLQWCDPETLAWLRFLLAYDRRARLLIAGTVRDDEVMDEHPFNRLFADLEQKGQCRAIALKPLGSGEVARLAAAVVGQTPSAAEATRLFAESEGNPLFLIEMLQAEIGDGSLRQPARGLPDEAATTGPDRRLPPRVQAVIRWRLAQLSPEARQLAMTASVIGRRFDHQLLASVSELPEQELVRYLDELWRRRIIREDEAGSYDFSHDRLREGAYGQIGPIQRRYLHQRVAQALERAHSADQGAVAGRIAHHYEQAAEPARARSFFEQAGSHAAARFANGEAARSFGRALAVALQEGASGEEVARLYVRRGRSLELGSRFDRAMENYQAMEGEARRRGDKSMLLSSLVSQVTLLVTPTALHDPVHGEVLAQEALSLAHQLQDEAAEARSLWNLLLAYGFTGRIQEATASGERALDLARKLNLREQMAFVLNDLGYRCYRQLGQLTRAREALAEASELWRELDNRPMLADSLSSLCTISVDAGEYEPALVYSEEARRISEASGNLWGQAHSLYGIGWVHWEYGRPDRAIAAMEACIHLGEKAGFMAAQTATRVELSLILAELGADEKSIAAIRQAGAIAETHFPSVRLYVLAEEAQLHLIHGRLPEAQAVLARVKEDPGWTEQVRESTGFAEASLALAQGKHRRALAAVEALLASYRQSEMRKQLPEFLYLQGRILQAGGENDAARRRFGEALEACQALGSRRLLWRVLHSLSQVEDKPAEAQRLRRQAREIVADIADHTGDPELRASFLNRPEVRELLDE
jgi:DNA-binding SARP family transcriptional activator/tetratricopeptide (TPR) repeat protein